MAPHVIAVANQKGGTGKTTLSMNLAAGLQKRAPTAVIDADPQRSASQWAQLSISTRRIQIPVLPSADNLAQRLNECAERYQYVVVDCPPAMHSDVVQDVLAHAECVLIPVLPSPMDLWASVGMVDIVTQARRHNASLNAFLVLNQLESRNALSRAMKTALTEFSVPAARMGLRRRAIYRRAALEGSSVYHLGALGSAAAEEIDAIIEEVFES